MPGEALIDTHFGCASHGTHEAAARSDTKTAA
jgi:hypothetical protein